MNELSCKLYIDLLIILIHKNPSQKNNYEMVSEWKEKKLNNWIVNKQIKYKQQQNDYKQTKVSRLQLRNTYHIYYADKVRVLLYVLSLSLLLTLVKQTLLITALKYFSNISISMDLSVIPVEILEQILFHFSETREEKTVAEV